MAYISPSKEELLASIRPGMKLTKDFLKRIYGYEISYPGFSEEAIAALEAVGCVRAREHYTSWVQEYESKRDAELKEVAHWYRLECEKQWEKKLKEGEEKRKRKETESEMMSRKQQWMKLSEVLGYQLTRTEK